MFLVAVAVIRSRCSRARRLLLLSPGAAKHTRPLLMLLLVAAGLSPKPLSFTVSISLQHDHLLLLRTPVVVSTPLAVTTEPSFCSPQSPASVTVLSEVAAVSIYQSQSASVRQPAVEFLRAHQPLLQTPAAIR